MHFLNLFLLWFFLCFFLHLLSAAARSPVEAAGVAGVAGGGYTDAVPLKNSFYKDNWELSVARAVTVTRFLVQAGMKAENLVAAGAGEYDPVSKDLAKNRRIELRFVQDYANIPTGAAAD